LSGELSHRLSSDIIRKDMKPIVQNSAVTDKELSRRKELHLYSVKESVNVKMTTAIIYESRFTFIGLQKKQQK
jgi:hypothetical protein